MLHEEIDKDMTSHGAKYKCSSVMKIEAGGILIVFRNSRMRRKGFHDQEELDNLERMVWVKAFRR
jgi:hypothetical protein